MAPCPFVSVPVCHKSVFYQNGWTDRAGFWQGGFFRVILHGVVRKSRYLAKLQYFPLELFRNSALGQFRHGISIVERAIKLARER